MPTFTSSTYSSYMSKWLIATGIFEALLATGFVVAALTSDNPRNGFLLTAAILGATAIALIAFGWRAHRRAAEAKRIDQTGLAGQATITGMTQTGVYVNEQPQIALDLMVQLPGRAPYQAQYKGIIPMMLLGRLTSGMPLAVKVDPADPAKVVIDWDQPAQPMGFPGGDPGSQMPGWTGSAATWPAAQGQGSGFAAQSGAQDESLGQIQQAMQAAGVQAPAVYASPQQGGYSLEQLRAWLRTNGIPASATIDQVQDSGQTVGDERMMTMAVTLHVPGQAPRKTPSSVAMVPVAAAARVFAGRTVPVRVAADNPNLMMFEWDRI